MNLPLLTSRNEQHPSFETTARVIAERRLSTLREISQQTLMVQNIEGGFGARSLSTSTFNLIYPRHDNRTRQESTLRIGDERVRPALRASLHL